MPDAELASIALAIAHQVAAFSSPVACRIKESVRGAQTGLAEGLPLWVKIVVASIESET